MKLVATNDVKYGMYLGQNIFRHDSLLALPKGAKITNKELEYIKNFKLNFLLIDESNSIIQKTSDLQNTLDVIHAGFKHNTLLTEKVSKELYKELEIKIKKNKRIQKYLNELRELDSYSFVHCINICIMVADLLCSDQVVDKYLVEIVLLALLHDIGRTKMKKIFSKEGALTEKEFEELKKHPMYSYKLLRKLGYTEYDVQFVLETHEKYDGSGYPKGLKQTEISELAQIILMCDVYNALSSYRPHRGAFDPHQVLEMMYQDKNKVIGEKFVNLFLERFTPYRVGTQVELDNGDVAVVKSLPPGRKLLPVIEILDENTGNKLALVDLAFNKAIRIVKIIEPY